MAELAGRDESTRLLAHAPAGVAAFSFLFPLVEAGLIGVNQLDSRITQVNAVSALVGTALLLPLHARHVYWAARGTRAPHSEWTLPALILVVVGTLPLAGLLWLPTFHVIVVSALVVLRPRWSVPIAAAATIVPLPIGLVFGGSAWLPVWYVIAVAWRACALFALVWLVGALRRVQAARTALAERAVGQERMRIDVEVRRTLGDGLEGIVAKGRRTPALLEREPSAVTHELSSLVEDARRTLTEARHLISGYHSTSLRSELDTAVSLLAAAGITTRLDAPDPLPDARDPSVRAQLRSATARALADQGTHEYILAVTQSDGGLHVHLRPDTDGPARERLPA